MRYSNRKEYKVVHRCARCGRKAVFINTGRFRVNANKNKLDVWLIYQCRRCRHTLNIPIYERVSPRKIPAELYEKFLANDEALAIQYGSELSLFKRGHFVAEPRKEQRR